MLLSGPESTRFHHPLIILKKRCELSAAAISISPSKTLSVSLFSRDPASLGFFQMWHIFYPPLLFSIPPILFLSAFLSLSFPLSPVPLQTALLLGDWRGWFGKRPPRPPTPSGSHTHTHPQTASLWTVVHTQGQWREGARERRQLGHTHTHTYAWADGEKEP